MTLSTALIGFVLEVSCSKSLCVVSFVTRSSLVFDWQAIILVRVARVAKQLQFCQLGYKGFVDA